MHSPGSAAGAIHRQVDASESAHLARADGRFGVLDTNRSPIQKWTLSSARQTKRGRPKRRLRKPPILTRRSDYALFQLRRDAREGRIEARTDRVDGGDDNYRDAGSGEAILDSGRA